MIVFMVAEKPSLAQSISKFLSNGQMASRKGFNNACSVHEWSGRFQNMNCKFKMTSVCGHVNSLDFTSKYNNWDKVDPVTISFKLLSDRVNNYKLLKMLSLNFSTPIR